MSIRKVDPWAPYTAASWELRYPNNHIYNQCSYYMYSQNGASFVGEDFLEWISSIPTDKDVEWCLVPSSSEPCSSEPCRLGSHTTDAAIYFRLVPRQQTFNEPGPGHKDWMGW